MVWVGLALPACNNNKLDADGDGFTELTNDCDDNDPNIHPDAIEVCYNGIDDNCNGLEDEEGATSGRVWYVDLDGDGYGNETVTVMACEQPENYASNKWDCNENDPNIHPDAEEICDTLDNDCDGEIDEASAIDAPAWFVDLDGDGFGDDRSEVRSCEALEERVLDGGDCDDANPFVNPAATEVCDEPIDEDCDGEIDEEDAFGCTDWYADGDGDGYAGTAACLCGPEAPYLSETATDCDDARADINPDAVDDPTDWVDQDCTGGAYVPLEEADRIIAGSTPASSEEITHLTLGDVDGDGVEDVAVSTTEHATGAGRIDLLPRRILTDGGHLTDDAFATVRGTEGAIVPLGSRTVLLHDLDDDGFDDLLTADYTSGPNITIHRFMGPLSGALDASTADELTGTNRFYYSAVEEARQGLLVLRPGPPDDSGQPTMFMAHSQVRTYANSTYRYLGDGTQWRLGDEGLVRAWDVLPEEGNRYGYAGDEIALAGDLDGDGNADTLIVDPYSPFTPIGGAESTRRGYWALYTDGLDTPTTEVVANRFYRNIGGRFAGEGDFDGDGYNDLAVAPYDSDHGRADGGAVHVAYGPFPEGTVDIVDLPQTIILGSIDEEQADCVVSPGDVDGDGADDLLIGGAGAPGGAVYVFTRLGEAGVIETLDATAALMGNGAPSGRTVGACAGATERRFLGVGDLDGDGGAEVLVGGAQADPGDGSATNALFIFEGVGR